MTGFSNSKEPSFTDKSIFVFSSICIQEALFSPKHQKTIEK